VFYSAPLGTRPKGILTHRVDSGVTNGNRPSRHVNSGGVTSGNCLANRRDVKNVSS